MSETRSKLYGTVKFLEIVPSNAAAATKRESEKRCWRQALSFLSDNPRHHHYTRRAHKMHAIAPTATEIYIKTR